MDAWWNSSGRRWLTDRFCFSSIGEERSPAKHLGQQRMLRRACGGRALVHAPSLKSLAPSPSEARAGRGLGRGARSIELWRSFEIPSFIGYQGNISFYI